MISISDLKSIASLDLIIHNNERELERIDTKIDRLQKIILKVIDHDHDRYLDDPAVRAKVDLLGQYRIRYLLLRDDIILARKQKAILQQHKIPMNYGNK